MIKFTMSLLATSFGFSLIALGQRIASDHVENLSDSIFNAAIEKGHLVGASVAIYAKDNVDFIQQYGLANISENVPVDAETLFQVGSIGKIFTAIAVMQLVEKSELDMDTDIQEYLGKNLTIDPSFTKPITLSHLLSHSAGFNEQIIGYGARSKEEIQPLGEHLKHRFPKRYTEPGLEISYSNYGYALAGYLVELASGQSFTDYISANILKPLGMIHSHYNMAGHNNKPASGNMATGYSIDSEGPKALDTFYRNPIPAGGLYSTAGDMLRFMKLFVGDSILRNSLVSQHSIQEMYKQVISNHPSLNGYGIGFEIQNFNGIKAFSKGGAIPGFRSIMILYPGLDMGLFATVNTNDDLVLEEFVESFNSKFLPNDAAIKNMDYYSLDIDRFTGSYRENRYNRRTIENVLALQYMNLWSGEDDTLKAYQDGAVQRYHSINDLVFQNVEDPSRLMVFESEDGGRIISMSRSNKMAGTMVPVKYEKLKWYDTPIISNELIGIPPLIIISYIFLPGFWGIVWVKRRRNKRYFQNKMLPSFAHASALGFLMVSMTWIITFLMPFMGNRSDLVFGMLPEIARYNFLIFLLPVLMVPLLISTVGLWRNSHGIVVARIYYSVFTLSALALVLFLYRWNFIGYNF